MKGWVWLVLVSGCPAAESYNYWIEPCSARVAAQSGCAAADAELAEWAIHAWAQASAGGMTVARVAAVERSRIRLYWAAGRERLYGEAVPLVVDGRRGAAIYVRPDPAQLGRDIEAACHRDRLFRDAVVYLTCLHESGHAFGLRHTARFDDIMYTFARGGDIVEYFLRYRRQIGKRGEIRRHPGISALDREVLQALYGR